MRAVFLNVDLTDKEIEVDGEPFHHLVNVVRVKLGDEILVLNGKGKKSKAMVHSISKKKLTLSVLNHSQVERKIVIDLALGLPKKDSLELCLRQATEIGIRNIFLVESDFSNYKDVDPSRLDKILISSLEQSNTEFLPIIAKSSWNEINYKDYDFVLKLDSQSCKLEEGLNKTFSKALMIVGPEGGFSDNEITFFNSVAGISRLHLPTGILRTSTAVSVGSGWLLKGLMDQK